ncbi:vascular endothelial growth factor D isoform X1 [Polyodon spathula]|uniref:vascular endothelial growth factor D isoform X1 n=1 Tax=Polyodon spathula TaxID=7913 RepID=UPI001B7E2C56|nr:vascular endothelial growth factor D isoform X1 [Polyodon spathula]XP_041115044.1 vascular endothelial growth factor D isoform X1 [Polyodon spathula]
MKTHCCIIMHLLAVSFARLMQGAEYDHDTQQSREAVEHRIRSTSNLEELLQTTHYEDWKLWKCRLKLKELATKNDPPLLTSHRSTRYAAAVYDLEILKAIDDEWQKIQCTPRETCVDVAKELATNTNVFFKPPCVSVFRCGGCCNEESLSCRNTSVSYITKTLFQISIPLTYMPQPVTLGVANHTACKCMPPTMIRRHAPHHHRDNSCHHSPKPCNNVEFWDSTTCQCVPYPQRRMRAELSPIAELAVCGPFAMFDEDLCECVCRRECPVNYSMNFGNCTCQCSESSETCAQKDRLFDPESCSCKWERECPVKHCQPGRSNKLKNCHCVRERKNRHP